MQKLLRFGGYSIIATIIAYSSAWAYVAYKAEKKVEESLLEFASNRNAATQFEIISSGWPFKVKLKIKDYTLRLHAPNSNNRVTINAPTPFIIETDVSNPGLFKLPLNNFYLNLSTNINGVEIPYTIITNGLWQLETLAEKNTLTGAFGELKITDPRTEKVLASIETLDFLSIHKSPESGLNNGYISIQVHDVESSRGLNIDKFVLQAGVDDHPYTQTLAELEKHIRDVIKTKSSNDAELKKLLKQYVYDLTANSTKFYVQDFTIKSPELTIHTSAEIGTDSQFRPEGKITVQMSNTKQLSNAMTNGNIPLTSQLIIQSLLGQNLPITVNFTLKNGMIMMNNIPLLPAIPLTEIIDTISIESQFSQ